MSDGNDGKGLSAEEKALSRAATMVQEARGDLTRLQGNLSGQIEAVRMRWQGEGGNAFQVLHTAWQEKQTRITRALDDFERSLLETEQDNTTTDQSQMDLMNRNLQRLG